ncbi:MAG: NfeD family protein [Candidatus Aminicenantaceae bacterium]
MILKIFIVIVLAWLLFELVEHAVVPLVWLVMKKDRRSRTGAEGMIGEVGEVREWNDGQGMVFVHGELWRAESEVPLSVGDKVVVQKVQQGLTLIVEPQQKSNGKAGA